MIPNTTSPTAQDRDALIGTHAPDNGPVLAAVFEDMAPYVLRVIPRMGVARSDVEDVAQDVFVAVHRGWSGFEGRSSARTWVYGICIRICADYRRRAARRPLTLELNPHSQATNGPDPERQAQGNEILFRLDHALNGLSDTQRAMFVLTDIEGLSVAQACSALKCPLFTAYARLYAARKKLRVALVDICPADICPTNPAPLDPCTKDSNIVDTQSRDLQFHSTGPENQP